MGTRIRAVVWDWNGTLLDDVGAGLATMNRVLSARGLAVMDDADAYRARFGFPVRDFYRRVGFETDDDFLAASRHYLELFPTEVARALVQEGGRETIAELGAHGLRQVLISATLSPRLAEQMAPHALEGLDEVIGIDAGAEDPSKHAAVEAWLVHSRFAPEEVVMVGDTNHDEQIADALGCRFIRFAHGHQEAPAHGRWPVVQSLDEVAPLVLRPWD